MEEDEEYDCEAEHAVRKRIGDGVGTGKIWNGSTSLRTKRSENTNVNMFMEKNLPVESSREPVDCPRNSTDEGGIPNDNQHAEEREVAISDEVGFIKCRVLQQVQELSARLASVEAQMRTDSFLHKLGSVDHVKREPSVSPLSRPLQCPVILSPPLILAQQEPPSDHEETGSGVTQWSPLLSQLEAFENSSCNSLAHDEADVAHSVDSSWALPCPRGWLENVPNFEEGGKKQRRKNLSLLEYVRVEVLGADNHGCGDPQVWISLSILNLKKAQLISCRLPFLLS